MEHKYCLNCDFNVDNKFCPSCGQKTATHRIEIKHFLMHDLLHGFWHLDKGILFTIKETFVRPGLAALDYIGGKRIRYYNVFYLSLLAIGTYALSSHFYDSVRPDPETANNDEFTSFISEYLKLMVFCIVPFFAINAKLMFKRLRLNFAEHLIMGGITLLGMIIISLLYLTMDFLNRYDIPKALSWLEAVFFFLTLLFPTYVYYNAIKNHYSFWGCFWRIMVFNLLILIQMILLMLIINQLVSGQTQFSTSL